MPQEFIADAIVKAARGLPGYPALRVLDLSCGRGEILSTLAKDGCTTRGTHYRSDDYKLADRREQTFFDGLAIDENVDLLKALPYESGSFDLVILSEVIEHLPNYMTVIRESARLLVPGGHLLVSFPNTARLHSRWHFFWTGTHKLVRRRVGWDLGADDLYAYHINPPDFPLLHTVLHQEAMTVEALRFTRFKTRHAWLLAFFPFIWIATQLETRRHVQGWAHRRGETDLRRWMMHPAMLASEQLLIVARRRNGDESP